jgi:acetyltransferase
LFTHVPEALRECLKGILVIMISAGFGSREEGLGERAGQDYRHLLVGPNCLGVIDTHTPLNASFAAGTPPTGPMAFMSQSGALGTAVLDIALAGRLGLSKFVSLGNKADVSEIDLLRAWENDEDTRVILIYSEGMPNGQEFSNCSASDARSLLSQSGDPGWSRAVSRTLAHGWPEQAYQAAFQQAGILRAESMKPCLILPHSAQPPLKDDRIAIITNAAARHTG